MEGEACQGCLEFSLTFYVSDTRLAVIEAASPALVAPKNPIAGRLAEMQPRPAMERVRLACSLESIPFLVAAYMLGSLA